MKAMVLESSQPVLKERQVPRPIAGKGQVLLKVSTCGVCRTDLQILDGELRPPHLPLILGHEIVGQVVDRGLGAEKFCLHDRVGVPWLGWTCGKCSYCCSGHENLCERALFTGFTLDGGYAEYAVADERFCFSIPTRYSDLHAAPLLCAGLIGYRCLAKTGDAKNLGIYGFGAAAHIVCQIAHYQGRKVFAFSRTGDDAGRKFAMECGASWAGNSHTPPPELLDSAIIFASDGDLVPLALKALKPGGTVICGGIHMSEFPAIPYELLWKERSVTTVANLTRRDGEEFFSIISEIPVQTTVNRYSLLEVNAALSDLRSGKFSGAAVLVYP